MSFNDRGFPSEGGAPPEIPPSEVAPEEPSGLPHGTGQPLGTTEEPPSEGNGRTRARGRRGTPRSRARTTGTDTAKVAGGGAAGASVASNVFKVAKFAAILDFLGYLAWIFHPATLLRAIEFALGVLVTMWGVYLLTGSSAGRRGPTSHPIIRRAISATPGGRVLRTAQGRRMGRHEGQREAARMEARQSETRSQRESSALEREQINRRARESARENQ